MEKQTSSTPNGTRSETLLRTTLQEYTSQLDLHSAWTTVAERLPMEKHLVQQDGKRKGVPFHFRQRRWRTIPVMVAAVMLAVCLMGAGIATAYTPFWKLVSGSGFGDASQYQKVDQQQQSNGVKITVTNAYADKGRTIIGFDISGPSAWSQPYTSISLKTFVLKDQGESLVQPTYNTICTTLSKVPVHCVAVLPPFHPVSGTTNLAITWNITALSLTNPVNHVRESNVFSGNWHFQFLVPFHWQNHNSQGPQVKP